MRKIDYIVIHCTATIAGRDFDSRAIANWWSSRGWNNPGYHYIIHLDGFIRPLLSHEGIANGIKGYNKQSIHISYIGGLDENCHPTDTRTPQQKESIHHLVNVLKRIYPSAEIIGHNDLANKFCPCFDAKKEYSHENRLEISNR